MKHTIGAIAQGDKPVKPTHKAPHQERQQSAPTHDPDDSGRQGPGQLLRRWFVPGTAIIATVSLATLYAADRPTSPVDSTWNTYRARFEQTQQGVTSLGAGSCASSNCHGGAKPKPGEVFLGDEWNRWYDGGKGPHFKAYKVLYEDPRSNRMAELLYGRGAVAKERRECLDCHGLYAEETYRGRSYDLEDGVSCEACHGRSERWLGPHQNPRVWRDKTTPDQRTATGFYDTRHLIHRTEQCLSCHLGTTQRRVTHAMMAAGHPPLTFELVTDSDGVPKHWNDEQCYLTPDEGTYFHARAWTVGQLITFRESMHRAADWLARRSEPDYALFDCYACHHDINTDQGVGWRQRRSLQGPLGEPMFDLAAWAMCRVIVEHVAGDQRERFAELVNELVHDCAPRGGNPARARETALKLASMSDALAQKMVAQRFDETSTTALLERLVDQRRFVADLGYGAAAQALFAVNALYCKATPNARCENTEDDAARAIARLHDHLFDEQNRARPAAYDPEQVVEALEAFGQSYRGQ